MSQATNEASQQQGLKEQASAKVEDAASAVQEKASELSEQGSARLSDLFERRSTEAGSQVRSLAEALRRGGTELSNEGNTQTGQLTRQVADRAERLGTYLEQKHGEELMRDLESFARRRPWILAGVGMLAGVAAARFMKASSEQRYGEYRRTYQQQWPARAGVSASRGTSGDRESGSGGYLGEQGIEGSDGPSGRTDDPLARDRYAGTR